ncbi:neutral zinc metallopeptidase [Antarcticibacterium sp. 1MA-6-2]|uniref:neutral zinc metallopeptidase n=1 Tax=Antarcticibacterium sp. 1MA-6-2 TaxID=2908210 RepID=UPI001F218D92|nr:neutral zinc metallopeptidase [Antarcticibacterium sp. 1MA-6-2]UJH92277.1 neutral zinc metallopeptidase [Antarcticibacterium sp. 1MA-6-2]
MNLHKIKATLLILAVGTFAVSCEKENLEQSTTNLNAETMNKELILNPNSGKSAEIQVSENIGIAVRNAVEPSECAPTELDEVVGVYIQQIIADPIALANNGIYSNINYYYSYLIDKGEQTFGAEGKFTSLMVKRERELSKFFELPIDIRVNGQHTANLNDRNVWISVLSNFYGYNLPDGSFLPLTVQQAAQIADQYLALNEASPNLPENPYFATDGFASSNGTIVIGDGLVRWLAEAGVEESIVWTGILAHEWSHQVQFNNYGEWYPIGAADNLPEATRFTELEADFFAAYYMTHKRGATYNWKRVEEFFELFFQIGDCSFTSNGHHGTPAQRMEAARLGFELANDAQKQGHILTVEELHEIFVEQISEVIPAPGSTK